MAPAGENVYAVIEFQPGAERDAEHVPQQDGRQGAGKADQDANRRAAAPEQVEETGGQRQQDRVDPAAGLFHEQLLPRQLDDIAVQVMHHRKRVQQPAAPTNRQPAQENHQARVQQQRGRDDRQDQHQRRHQRPQHPGAADPPSDSHQPQQRRQDGQPGRPEHQGRGQNTKGCGQQRGRRGSVARYQRPGPLFKPGPGQETRARQRHREELVIRPLPEVGEEEQQQRGKPKGQ